MLDLAIILGVLAAGAWGAMSGFARQLGSAIGLWAGLFAGSLIAQWTAGLVAGAASKLIVTSITIVVVVMGLLTAGEHLGRKVAVALDRAYLGPADQVLGAVVSAVATLLAVWIMATSLAGVRLGGLAEQIQGSSILTILDAELPPVPAFAARLGRVVDPFGFPRVFAGLEPGPAAPVTDPTDAEVAAAVAAGQESTVKIEGKGCGGILDGSGYVAAPGLVVTNAHVVAGIRTPEVVVGGQRLAATTVVFDPGVDLAVVRVPGLTAPVLPLVASDADRGAVGVALGYPGGGAFTVSPAAVRATYPAVGRDIYGSGLVTRNVYELQANVKPGNSGGPVVLADGQVAGVVFARSVSYDGIGYALAASEVRPRVAEATTQTTGVSTGACAAP